MQHALETALAEFNTGRLQEAAAICSQILAAEPGNGSALNLLGLVHRQIGDTGTAIDYLQRAVAVEPHNLARLCNLGCLLQEANRFAEAENVLQQALALEPNFPEACHNLGVCLHHQGRLTEAAAAYERAIALRPDYFEPIANLALIYKTLERFDLAEQVLRHGLTAYPDHADLLRELGTTLYRAGKMLEAADVFRRLTRVTPDNALAHFNLGVTLEKAGRPAEAEPAIRRAIALAPNQATAYNTLGIVLREQGRLAEAEACQQRAVTLDPDMASAWNDLGTVLQDQEKLNEAERAYTKALELDPGCFKAIYNLGNLHLDRNQPHKAILLYRQTLAREPELAEAHWNLAQALLLDGQYQEGWREYEWRWRVPEHPGPPTDLPIWDGTPLGADQPLLVFAEQGVGDAIQFLRFLPRLGQRVAKTVFVCQDSLLELARASLPATIQVEPADRIHDAARRCTCQISLLSLPLRLGLTSLESLPADTPYLRPPDEHRRRHAGRISVPEDTLSVGIVWRGNPKNKTYFAKSLPVEFVARLAAVPRIRLFSLQKDADDPLPDEVTDLAPLLDSFADTAALIEQLDLVISIDTSVAHLAGGLGIPTWTLLPFVPPDWRYMLDRDDSPWYPSMRIWRQTAPGDWDGLIARIEAELPHFDPATATPAQPPRRPATITQPTAGRQWHCLYLGLSSGKNFGWGVCSSYLARELAKMVPTHLLNEQDGSSRDPHLPGPLFTAIRGVDMSSLHETARGTRNYGYTFFENELPPVAHENAKQYDLILAGSSWCRDRLREAGIEHCGLLIQGIDPEIFHPEEPAERAERTHDRPFTIFSGGKFELRKGQDLVLRAFKILQEKYPDMVLVTCWQNIWPQTMRLMAVSPHITYTHREGDWQTIMHQLYADNGLDPERIVTLGLQDNRTLRRLYLDTDIGLFPNRCEGGTNLVLMEYMACGRPVIASNTSGHRDIVTQNNAILLNDLKPFNLVDDHGHLAARWEEPSIDEIVAAVEYAYHNREAIRKLGQQAGTDMRSFTWERSAQQLLRSIA